MQIIRFVETGDAARVAAKLDRYAARGKETTPVMWSIVGDMIHTTGMVFASNGRRGGGSWRRLKSDTIRKKGTVEILRTRGAFEGYSRPGEDALYESVTHFGAPGQIVRVTRRAIEFGTNVPAAAIMQHGAPSRNIPARPFLRFLPTDTARWGRMILEYLMETTGARSR